MDEPVVDDDLSATQEREAPHRHEPGIAGPGADERDRAYGAHVSTPRSSSSRSLAVSRPRSTMSRRTSGPSARRHASAGTARPEARTYPRAPAPSAASRRRMAPVASRPVVRRSGPCSRNEVVR